MSFQPPLHANIHDVWIAGLILAGLVEIEFVIIIYLSLRLRALATPKANNRENNPHNKRRQPTNLPK